MEDDLGCIEERRVEVENMNLDIGRLKEDEIEISIKRIVEECVKKLHLIVISAVVLATVITTLLYLKEIKVVNEYNNSLNNNNVAKEEVQELSKEDIIAIDKYFLLEAKVEQIEKYGEESVFLKMDFNNVYQGKVQFYVEANENVKSDISNALVSYIKGNEFIKKVYEIEDTTKIFYKDELIEVQYAERENGNFNGIIDMSILAKTEDESVQYINAAKNIIQDYSSILNTTIEEHNLSIVREEYVNGYSDKVYLRQKEYLSEWQAITTEFKDYTNSLTYTQKANIFGFREEVESDKKEELPTPSFNIKYFVSIFILVILIASGCIFVLVVFGRKIQSEEEINRRLGITCFGTLKQGKCDKGQYILNKVLYRRNILDKDQQLKMICTRIELYCQKNGLNNISFISTINKSFLGNIVEVKNVLKEKGIECEIVENILYSEESLKKVINKKNTILVEILGNSKIKEIYKEFSLCEEVDIQVGGYILLCL